MKGFTRAIVNIPDDLYDHLLKILGSRKTYKTGARMSKLIVGYLRKGLDHEKDLELSGYRQAGISETLLVESENRSNGRSRGNNVQSNLPKPDRAELQSEVHSCHGSPMLDYGTHWYCLVGNHKEPKSLTR